MLKIKPIGNRIVVEPVEEKASESPGGIVLPDTVDQGSGTKLGVIVALDFPGSADIGTKIVFSEFSGTEYEEDGKQYLIMRYSDILATIEEQVI